MLHTKVNLSQNCFLLSGAQFHLILTRQISIDRDLIILMPIVDKLHHRDCNPAISVPVTSPDKGGVFGGRGADTAASQVEDY
jgi:hypothetical protein